VETETQRGINWRPPNVRMLNYTICVKRFFPQSYTPIEYSNLFYYNSVIMCLLYDCPLSVGLFSPRRLTAAHLKRLDGYFDTI